MTASTPYDVAICGGGLAGLTLSIQLAQQGHRVILFEKETYPFNRVCGEYISLESWDFLEGLGMPLDTLELSKISRVFVSGRDGGSLDQALPLGGFGISRFLLDEQLAGIARKAGVELMENVKVNAIDRLNDGSYFTITTNGSFRSRYACGCFGKRSNLDVGWGRPFTKHLKNSLNNYIGVKYHLRGDFRNDTVELHLFDKGYAGLVKIDGDKYNLCYLTTADNLRQSGNSIERMESEILSRNPFIKKIFAESEKMIDKPVTISQISFEQKSHVENHMMMIGDAAGMITPLCGNGMSMAMNAGKMAAGFIHSFLENELGQEEMEQAYSTAWEQQFSKRMTIGRFIQRSLYTPWMSDMMISLGRLSPRLLNLLIRQTHGKPF